MQLGSQEHKTQFFQDLIKIYHENIWKDEMHLSMLADVQGNKRKEIAGIELKMENKEFKSANEGKKALFVAEQELKHIEKEIAEVIEKKDKFWPARIQFVKDYAKSQDIEIE
jgi:hypothetical protein